MKNFFPFIALIIFCFLAYEKIKLDTPKPTINHQLCLQGCPSGTSPDNILVDHKIFILSSNIKTKFADWVAYKITKENLQGESLVKRIWTKDPNISELYTLIPKDYEGATEKCGYDRGHQAPLADFKGSKDAYRTNYLSNITPQKSLLNRGVWKNLEKQVRDLINTHQEIFVMTGPYYNNEKMCDLPNARIINQVPNGYWIIIAAKENNKIKTIAFSFSQNILKEKSFCGNIKSVKQIEEISKLKFFSIATNTIIDEELLMQEICFEEYLYGL